MLSLFIPSIHFNVDTAKPESQPSTGLSQRMSIHFMSGRCPVWSAWAISCRYIYALIQVLSQSSEQRTCDNYYCSMTQAIHTSRYNLVCHSHWNYLWCVFMLLQRNSYVLLDPVPYAASGPFSVNLWVKMDHDDMTGNSLGYIFSHTAAHGFTETGPDQVNEHCTKMWKPPLQISSLIEENGCMRYVASENCCHLEASENHMLLLLVKSLLTA